MSLPSAGTISPARSSAMSPRTRSHASRSRATPSRRQRARAGVISRSAESAPSAFASWSAPIMAFTIRMARIAAASFASPTTSEIAAAATSNRTIVLLNCRRKSISRVGGASTWMRLGPSRSSRACASCSKRPRSGSTPRSASTSSAAAACGMRCSAEASAPITASGQVRRDHLRHVFCTCAGAFISLNQMDEPTPSASQATRTGTGDERCPCGQCRRSSCS